MKTERKLFIFDDDSALVALLQRIAQKTYKKIFTALSCTKAMELIQSDVSAFDLVLTDLNFPDGSGMDILRTVKKHSPLTAVALFTGFASLETAIQALHEGAFDYVTKPFTLEQIMALLNKMETFVELQSENLELRRRMEDTSTFANRQITRIDDLFEELGSLRGMLQEQGTAIRRIQDTLDAMRTPTRFDFTSKT